MKHRANDHIPDICQLLIDALLLQLARPSIPQIGNELDETAHVIAAAA